MLKPAPSPKPMPVAPLRKMPLQRLRKLQAYQSLVGITKPTQQTAVLKGLKAELEARRRQLTKEVDLDSLINGGFGAGILPLI